MKLLHTDTQTVLIIEDDQHNRALLTDLLQQDCKIILAKDGEMALKLLAKHQPDLILLDLILPGMDGYQLLKRLKSADQARDIPVIIISALNDPNDEEQGLILGASDYITKPFHPAIVRARVRNHLQAAAQRELLIRLAMVDPLTGASNRRKLDLTLQQEWPQGTPLSMIVIDVDHFKLYNDHYGHSAGDTVLKQITAALQQQLKRETDLLARIGGEEFVLFLPHTDQQGGLVVAEIVRLAVQELAIPHQKSTTSDFISISLGGITHLQTHADAPHTQLIPQADEQLYRAKQQGRNQTAWGEA